MMATNNSRWGDFIHPDAEDTDIYTCKFNKLQDMILQKRIELIRNTHTGNRNFSDKKVLNKLGLTHNEKMKYDVVCNKPFIKSTAKQSAKEQVNFKGYGYPISEEYKQYKYRCSGTLNINLLIRYLIVSFSFSNLIQNVMEV